MVTETPKERTFMFKYQKEGHKKYTKEIIPESKLEPVHKNILLNELVEHMSKLPTQVQEAFITGIMEQFKESAKKVRESQQTMPVIKEESTLIKL